MKKNRALPAKVHAPVAGVVQVVAAYGPAAESAFDTTYVSPAVVTHETAWAETVPETVGVTGTGRPATNETTGLVVVAVLFVAEARK